MRARPSAHSDTAAKSAAHAGSTSSRAIRWSRVIHEAATDFCAVLQLRHKARHRARGGKKRERPPLMAAAPTAGKSASIL